VEYTNFVSGTSYCDFFHFIPTACRQIEFPLFFFLAFPPHPVIFASTRDDEVRRNNNNNKISNQQWQVARYRAGDRVFICGGKYTPQTAVFVRYAGVVSVVVKLSSNNKDKTIRASSNMSEESDRVGKRLRDQGGVEDTMVVLPQQSTTISGLEPSLHDLMEKLEQMTLQNEEMKSRITKLESTLNKYL
jgi:hypothetical protein